MTREKQIRTKRLLTACALIGLCATAQAQSSLVPELGEQPLNEALRSFATQTGLQLIYVSEPVLGQRSKPVPAGLSPEEALKRLLEGTGLTFEFINDRTVEIRPVTDAENAGARYRHMSAGALRLAQSSSPSSHGNAEDVSRGEGLISPAAQEPQSAERISVEEIVVTGTHIRGTEQPTGARLITVDEEQIRQSGYSTVHEVIQSLPQNFGGGVSEDTTDTNVPNPAKGTALNLRGLGVGSTLTLVNGRRITASGQFGNFTDVTSIPLTAVERIEVLPDGASALYGSDAVGGVVNIVLKKKYEGAATQARLGTVTHGPLDEYQVSQSLGIQWGAGSALVALEARRRDALPASARREMDSDLRSQGGSDFRTALCNPGTIIVGTQTYAIPAGQDGTALAPEDLVSGTVNRCNRSTGADALAEEQRWNIFTTLRQQLTDSVELFGDVSYANRDVEYGLTTGQRELTVPSTNAFYVNPTGGTEPLKVQYDLSRDLNPGTRLRSRVHNVALGTTIDIGPHRFEGYVGESGEEQRSRSFQTPDPAALAAALADSNPLTALNPFGDGSHTNPATLASLRESQYRIYEADSRLRQASLKADGPLLHLPAGPVKFAIGGDYWEQTLQTLSSNVLRTSPAPVPLAPVAYTRRVKAAFAEFLVPLIGEGNRRPGFEALEFSLAGRYESYNDFGDAAVPRLGLRWSPVDGFSFRAAWSESFKAPQPTDLIEANNTSVIVNLPDPGAPAGSSAVLLVSGGNAALREETAEIWTAGFDWSPEALKGFSIGVSYFNTDFTNRVGRISNANLADPSAAPAITRDPTEAQRDAVCSNTSFSGNFSGIAGDCGTANVAAIFDLRVRNQASVRQRGVDVLGSYDLLTGYGRLRFELNATYLFEYLQALTESAPPVELLDTPGNPLNLRLRSAIGWSFSGFSATAFINYADDYRDTISQPNRPIGSWTTVDVNAGYDFSVTGSEWLDGCQITLNAQNVFDRRPPFYNNATGIGYDPANADLLRRFLSLSVRKVW